MIGLADDDDNRPHSQTKKSSLSATETHVQELVSHISANMTNPFSLNNPPVRLINIANGMFADDKVQKTLLSVAETGKEMVKNFVESSLRKGNYKKKKKKNPMN